jgi:predicted nuclease of predicted toxin-antitoxin system
LRLRDCHFLADQNLHVRVVDWLRVQGFDVLSTREAGLRRAADTQLIDIARAQQRVILTHDLDFGELAVRTRLPVHGVVLIRSVSGDPHDTIVQLATLLATVESVEPPFIVTVRGTSTHVVIRIRQLR